MNGNRRPRTNRRTVLKSITAGSGAFLSTTNVVGSAGDRVEVVMEWQGNDPYVTRKVPKRWKQHMGTTRRLASELTEHFKDDGDIFGFERIPGSLNRGGKSAPQLGARVRKGSGAQRSVPKERDGVPIKVEEIENNHVTALTDAGCVNNYSFDKLWGGIILNTSQDAQFPIYPRGSTMCTARGPDGTEYCITANHLFSDGDGEYPCDANWDDFAYQHDDTTDDQYVGEVDKYHEDMDYARLPLANLGPKYDIASASWSGPVVGHASSTRLGELVENDTTCEKMGMKTGASQGPLTADSSDVTKDCWDTNNNAFQHHARTVVGDSGGPVYTQSESGDGISMIGLIAGTRTLPNLTTECGENTHEEFFGPPAWHMSDHWDLSFYKP